MQGEIQQRLRVRNSSLFTPTAGVEAAILWYTRRAASSALNELCEIGSTLTVPFLYLYYFIIFLLSSELDFDLTL